MADLRSDAESVDDLRPDYVFRSMRGVNRGKYWSDGTVEIYVPLLNEGTDVLRPTQGRVLGPEEVEILAAPGYDPTIEEWAFPPGTKVRCVREAKGGRSVLVARQRSG